jgi:acylphosphatase
MSWRDAEKKRFVKARIRGQVQGVGYRAWTAATARRHGVLGYVRNCANGDVEALFAGPASAVGAMIEACFQGPRLARVVGVDIEEISGARQDEFQPLTSFAIMPLGD